MYFVDGMDRPRLLFASFSGHNIQFKFTLPNSRFPLISKLNKRNLEGSIIGFVVVNVVRKDSQDKKKHILDQNTFL